VTDKAATPETPEAPKPVYVVVDAPPKTANESLKAKLAEFQAAQKAARAEEAKPLVAGIVGGQAVSDGVTYVSHDLALKEADKAKRLVAPGLAEAGLRPSVRVNGADTAWTWFVTGAPKKAEATVEEAAATE